MNDKMNITTNQPFGFSFEVTWILSITLPILIAVSGWIVVYLLNRKHMTQEKRIIVKIQSFDYLKNSLNSTLKYGTHLYSYLLMIKATLERFTPDSVLYKYDHDELLKDFNKNKINKFNNNFNDNFIEFISAWEQYELVFKELVIQRYALQAEFSEALNNFTKVWGHYHAYLNSLAMKIQVSDEMRTRLISSLDQFISQSIDFTACINDVNLNIQNYVFGKILDSVNDKRIVQDKSYLTIDTLIEKHQNELEKKYNVKFKIAQGRRK